MSRRYSPQEKQLIVQKLASNGFNIPLTSSQTGVPERTLLTWRTKYFPVPPPPQQQGGTPLAGTPLTPLPADSLKALQDIQRKLMDKVNSLSHSIDDAIIEAPLIQRSAALVQIIDRIVKISTLVPPDAQDDVLEGNIDGDETDGETQFAQSASQAARNSPQ